MRYTLIVEGYDDPLDFYSIVDLQHWLEENWEDLQLDELEDELELERW